MAKNTKVKNVSINAIETVMTERYIPTEQIDWFGNEVIIQKTLSFPEMINFINFVVNACFGDNDEYLPEAKEYAIKVCILSRYANFNISSNNANMYNLIYCTNAVETVLRYINMMQYNEILSAINEKINCRVQANVSLIKQQLETMMSAYENLERQLSGLFDGIDGDTMLKMATAIGDGRLDEEKLVKAYIAESNKEVEQENGEN